MDDPLTAVMTQGGAISGVGAKQVGVCSESDEDSREEGSHRIKGSEKPENRGVPRVGGVMLEWLKFITEFTDVFES